MGARKLHGDHKHGGLGHHHHHHDNAYLTSGNKADAGVRITRIGLYSNLAMAIAKGVGGYMFHSHAMVADAWHSVTDLASDILTLATVSWSSKDPSTRFPSGYGKVESLGSLGVSGMLLAGGLMMGWSSTFALLTQLGIDPSFVGELAHHGHSHSHSHAGVPSMHAAWLAAGTILVKEWLYRATMKVAIERQSSVLASNAIHHRVDSWTGVVTLVAVVLANFMENAAWLDPVGGLLISLLVIKAGAENTVSAISELIDRGLDDETKSSVKRQVSKALETITEGHEVEVRRVAGTKSGQNLLIDLELAVPGAWTVEDVREVENGVRERIGSRIRGARRVRVRFVSRDAATTDGFDEFVSGEVSPEMVESEAEEEAHEHDHSHSHSHSNGHANGNGNSHANGNGNARRRH